jgi:MFS family permease
MHADRALPLYGWRHPAILAVTGLSVASGFAQFGVAAALADVAAAFGEATRSGGGSLISQVGLSGTTIGLGLASIRLASVGALPLSSLADRLGRRRVLLACAAVGLALTALASTSPAFWWFVAFFALARPPLSATNSLAALVAAEETRTADRATAVALVAAGYGFGAGAIAVIRSTLGSTIGWRGLFLLAVVPLLLLPLLARAVREPARFLRAAPAPGHGSLLEPMGIPQLRRRLLALIGMAFSIAFVTGPANTFLFLYSERVLGLGPGATAGLVLAAGPVGVLGLVVGRLAADRLGRRPAGAAAQVLVAAACALTYSGSVPRAVVGYLAAIFGGSSYAPAIAAMAAELFPTRVRGAVAGWATAAGVLGAVAGLVAFGLLADAFDGFGGAAVAVAVPVALLAGLFALVPETRHLELEDAEAVGR